MDIIVYFFRNIYQYLTTKWGMASLQLPTKYLQFPAFLIRQIKYSTMIIMRVPFISHFISRRFGVFDRKLEVS